MTITLILDIKGAPVGDEYTEARSVCDKLVEMADSVPHVQLVSLIVQ